MCWIRGPACTMLLAGVSVGALLAGEEQQSRSEPILDTATWQQKPLPENAIAPEDLEYKGAFALPKDGSGRLSWNYATCALTYCPKGDPDGADDGYPGSLFGAGHEQAKCISEVSIPVPLISKAKSVKELNRAHTLRPFVSVAVGTKNKEGREYRLPVNAICWLPKQGDQTSDKIYFCGWLSYTAIDGWTRGWCDADLSKPAGMWRLERHSAFEGASAMMEIPKDWADKYCPGMYLAYAGAINGTHGYETSRGPVVIAAAPWRQGNPPEPGTLINNTTLLRYEINQTIRDAQVSDGWHGAAWATCGDKSAILFFGTKDLGQGYYGYNKTPEGWKIFDNHGKIADTDAKRIALKPDGTYVPYTPFPGNRGWKADFPKACIYFYNPADLAAVARGEKKPFEPQPYARLEVDELMFRCHDLHGCGYDRERGLLYVGESRGETRGESGAPIVHVWKIRNHAAQQARQEEAAEADDGDQDPRKSTPERTAAGLLQSAQHAELVGQPDMAKGLYNLLLERFPARKPRRVRLQGYDSGTQAV